MKDIQQMQQQLLLRIQGADGMGGAGGGGGNFGLSSGFVGPYGG